MALVDDWPLDGSVKDLLEGISTAGGNLDGLNLQLRKAEIKLQQEQISAVKRANELNEKLIDGNFASRKIAQAQLNSSEQANELARELLLSNQQASEQGEKDAQLMNSATEQLAKSTKSLKWATWALVGFTALQAIIALMALLTK